MFTIIQSHKTENLVRHLGESYSQKRTNVDYTNIFDEFIVLVPSMVLGDWLQKAIANQYGISTLVTTTFWGQYQWQIMQMVLEQYNKKMQNTNGGDKVVKVPEVAVLSSTVMQWRLFAYLVNYQQQFLADEKNPLYAILKVIIKETSQNKDELLGDFKDKNEQRLWQMAKDFAKVYNRYLTHRSHWLDGWENNTPIAIQELINKKDFLSQQFESNTSATPDWLVEHYIELEKAQRYLWRVLFAGAYQHRRQIEKNFWQGITDESIRIKSGLPSCLYLFTVQQLPLSELAFLKRLSQFIDVKLFHYNPSQMFWADIVDKKWLAHQQIINPQNVYLRDYGHTLLSRLGKQSRETFASLANLSGNEEYNLFQLDWHDDFPNSFNDESINNSQNSYLDLNHDNYHRHSQLTLLHRLQYDVLMLEESGTQQQANQEVLKALQNSLKDGGEKGLEDKLKQKNIPNNRNWELSENYSLDDSLQIHSCHSLQRQLEVLRGRIAYWLNSKSVYQSTSSAKDSQGSSQPSRQLSDIVVLLPDVESNDDLIRSVFVEGMGQDGLWLPARVTGVVDKSIRQLWKAICGYYRLLGANFSRFEASEVIEWLTLPTMVESLGITAEQMSRGCELLVGAGFIRGFDEQHLQLSLNNNDQDYRFSFAYALDTLVLGLAMPQAQVTDCLYDTLQETEKFEKNELLTCITEQTLPSSLITLNDAPIIDALCRVYQSLNHYRNEYSKSKRPKDWIDDIENQIIHPLFSVYDQTKEMRAIFSAMNGFRRSLRANERPKTYYPDGNFEQEKSPSRPPLQAHHALEANAALQKEEDFKTNLNLRLEFVLESIEESLESQQISAEPTGVITFARFGSLRTVPYKLVVMLNMNLSEFPRQDKDDRYDLMKAGLSERGDRSGEDDDNGAFLDALLCAKDNCWIFYNGHSLHDTHEHLPANPVSELLQFFQGEVKWQSSDTLLTDLNQSEYNKQSTDLASVNLESLDLANNIEQYLPKLIKNWLVVDHPPLPFSAQVFKKEVVSDASILTNEIISHTNTNKVNDTGLNQEEKQESFVHIQKMLDGQLQQSKLKQQQKIPPAPLWSNVYHKLHDDNIKKINNAVQLLTLQQYQQLIEILQNSKPCLFGESLEEDFLLLDSLPTHLDINQLSSQVRNPAFHYLRQQQVRIAHAEEELVRQEPLSLSGLSNYQVKNELLNNLNNYSDSELVSDKERTTAQTISSIQQMLYSPIIPAGVARKSTLHNQQNMLQQQLEEFADSIGIALQERKKLHNLITPCHEVSKVIQVTLFGKPHEIQLKGHVPVDNVSSESTQWLKILPNTASGKHLLTFWLTHIYWQIIRNTSEKQVQLNDGESIWYFNKPNSDIKALKDKHVLTLQPITVDRAVVELQKWLMYAELCGQLPIVLMPEYALTYLEQFYQHVEDAQKNIKSDSFNNPYDYYPRKGDFSRWTGDGFNKSNIIYDTDSHHEAWQFLLGDLTSKPFEALKPALKILAEPIFGAMYHGLLSANADVD